ncbi:TPA: hypothetical protein TVE87_001850 [Streptococcus equi subsp. zooepidemicus]|uniref:hypothetical protein n=1 Tax=Streptococcus equi TaxID=1336 RepID=UPI00294AE70F|nr:hypothetical protein [Streptococcus equi]WOK57662.1 hypothetical protein RIM63_02490 [Streptococcus equi subsp. zooepidemicus]HEL1075859.1 hypothetical protein [Streptococcus equi subsp. zooepidemicus]
MTTKYFYKLLLTMLTLALGGFSLSACHSKISKPYQVAIFDKDHVRTFMEKADGLVPVETISRTQHKLFERESFKQAKQGYFAKTREGNDLKVLLTHIDQASLEEKVLHADGNDAYTSTTDGDYFYTTAVFADRIDCYRYDRHLKKQAHKSIPNQDTINASNQFLVIDDTLYLLVSAVDIKSQQPKTELWKMDKSFTITDRIDLNESTAYLRMVNVGRTLYITQAADGILETGEPRPGNKVMTYDLDSGQKSYLMLHVNSPRAIYHHAKTNELIIENDQHYNPDFAWTIYQLDTGEERTIRFEELAGQETSSPYFMMTSNSYYFLFPKKLYRYDCSSHQMTCINLDQYGVTHAHAMIAKPTP